LLDSDQGNRKFFPWRAARCGRGCGGHRAFPAPLHASSAISIQSLGECRREDVDACLTVIARSGATTASARSARARRRKQSRCPARPGDRSCKRDFNLLDRGEIIARNPTGAEESVMNRAWLLLSILLLTARPAAAAELSLPAKARASQTWQVPQGPLGACRIYVQGRYSACKVTSEPVCQRLSEVWHKPRYAIVLRRWYALPDGLAWDMPPC
jgi:hypothetical protein